MIQVDISNVWGALALRDLLEIEAEVAAAHQILHPGETPDAHWRGCPPLCPSEETARLRQAAQKIRAESEICLVVGIDNACLGARAAIELLQGANRNLTRQKGDPQIFFVGNSLSTRQWNELTALLSGRDVSLIAVSRSGEELEPAIAFRHLRWLLERKYGTDEANRRIYAVTQPEEGSLRILAKEKSWECFTVPGSTGEGFSVLTAAGLLPMAVAGIDIEEVLAGAAEAAEEYAPGSLENPVWLYAALRNLLYRKGRAVEIFASFEPGFRTFGLWWQQLMGQGKDGKGIFPATAELPADLYALEQRLLLGEQNLFETLIRFREPEQEMTLIADVHDLDELNYLEGKSLAFVEEQAFQSAVETHADAGVPVIVVDCGIPDAGTVGALLCFLSLGSALSACVLGADPFRREDAKIHRQNLTALLGKPAKEAL